MEREPFSWKTPGQWKLSSTWYQTPSFFSRPDQVKLTFHSDSLNILPSYSFTLFNAHLTLKYSLSVETVFTLININFLCVLFLKLCYFFKFHFYSTLTFHSCKPSEFSLDWFAICLVFASKCGTFQSVSFLYVIEDLITTQHEIAAEMKKAARQGTGFTWSHTATSFMHISAREQREIPFIKVTHILNILFLPGFKLKGDLFKSLWKHEIKQIFLIFCGIH